MRAAPSSEGKASVWRRLRFVIAIAFICLPLSSDPVASAAAAAVGIPSYLLYSIGMGSLTSLVMLVVIWPQISARAEARKGSRWNPGAAVWVRLGAFTAACAVMAAAAFLLVRTFVVVPKLARPEHPLVWLMILILAYYIWWLSVYGLTVIVANALSRILKTYVTRRRRVSQRDSGKIHDN